MVPQEQLRTYYRGRGCINASWPTWPEAVWSLSESLLTESGAAVCLYGPLFGAEVLVCHFLGDTELCGPESLTPAGTQHPTLTCWLHSRLYTNENVDVCTDSDGILHTGTGILTQSLSVCVRI